MFIFTLTQFTKRLNCKRFFCHKMMGKTLLIPPIQPYLNGRFRFHLISFRLISELNYEWWFHTDKFKQSYNNAHWFCLLKIYYNLCNNHTTPHPIVEFWYSLSSTFSVPLCVASFGLQINNQSVLAIERDEGYPKCTVHPILHLKENEEKNLSWIDNSHGKLYERTDVTPTNCFYVKIISNQTTT